MLQIAYIRENKEEVIKRLAKKNMDATTLIELVVDLDEKRRATQVELDTIKAESNKLSKDIGELMKSGEKAKAEILKEKSIQLLEELKADDNKVTRVFTNLGIEVKSSAESQGILELKHELCERKKCISCVIGTKILYG